MIEVEASIAKLAPEPQDQTLKDAPALDADNCAALTFAAYMTRSYRVVQVVSTDEAPRHQSPKEEGAPRQGHRTEYNKRQGTQERKGGGASTGRVIEGGKILVDEYRPSFGRGHRLHGLAACIEYRRLAW